MLEKDQLIHNIELLIKAEEDAIDICSKHMDTPVFFSGFSESEQSKLKELIEVVKEDSRKHKEIYENLLKRVEDSDKNVF